MAKVKINPETSTCKRCGSTDVAWFKSKRTGKPYLCEVFTDSDGDRVSSHRDFHSKYCGVEGAHEGEQNNRLRREERNSGDIALAADERAFEISNLDSVVDRVLAVADLTRENPTMALHVRNIWRRQGENLLADMLDGIINAH